MNILKYLLFISTVLVSNFLFSQSCLPGYNLFAQSDIDNFATNYPGCVTIEGDLYIDYEVTNLLGLSQLTKINGVLDIFVSDVDSLNGLENIDSLGALYISRLSEIEDYSPLSSLEYVEDYFHISGSNGKPITDLPFNNLSHIGGDFTLINIEGLVNVDKFDQVNHLGGDLNIVTLNDLETISSFTLVDSIMGEFQILHCNKLDDLSGFQNIEYVGNIFSFGFLASLEDLSIFNQLKHIEATLTLGELDLLDSINSFNNLEYCAGITFYQNDVLKSLGEFQKLKSLPGLKPDNRGGIIRIEGNPLLTDITGLTTIDSISGYLSIINNPLLEDITPLVNINGSSIKSNFNGVDDITIIDNTSLSACSVKSLCEALEDPTTTVTLSNNGTVCNTVSEIEAECCPSSLIIDWDPVLSGTYISSGNIYFHTDTIRENQQVILSHGPGFNVIFDGPVVLSNNSSLDVEDAGCN